MRLSSSPAATCLASLCLATTTARAFFVPSPALTDFSLARGHRSACARCTSPIPMQMATTNGDDVSKAPPTRASRRAALLGHASKLFTRRRSATKGSAAIEVDTAGTGEVARLPKRQRRAREVMRRSVAAVATAVIVRSSFTAQPASAIMPKLRGPSAQQQMVDEAHREERRAAMREEMAKEQQATLDAATSNLNGEITAESTTQEAVGEQGATGAVVGESGGAVGDAAAVAAVGEENQQAVATPEPPAAPRKLTRQERTTAMRKKFNAKGFNPNTYPIQKADAGTFGAVIMGSFAVYNIMSSFKGSTDVMGNQRRRVKVEGAKFDQQKEEFMNVDGKAEVDVDMMKELRDMKEKMAGPGDKYAKDTRTYNPDFAAEHPEDEYDARLEEILKSTGKKGKTSRSDETGIVFSSDDSPAAASDGDDEGEGGENAEEIEKNSDADADAAIQAKKDADVKRLQDLFNSSPSDDNDTPEDDLGDKRELLP